MLESLKNFPGLGNTMSGLDADSNEMNNKFLGGMRWFGEIDRDRSDIGPWKLDTGAWICAILLRNISGGALLGGNLARLTDAGSTDKNVYTQVEGYGNAAWLRSVVLIDPWIPTAGVADDELFWGIIKGPAPGRTPQLSSSFLGELTPGGPVFCSADALGRITGPKATPASATEAYQQSVSVLGTSTDNTYTNEKSTQQLVVWNIPIFG